MANNPDVDLAKLEMETDVLPRYSLKDLIGAGSHGVVFSATDSQLTAGQDPTVAIKRIKSATLHHEGLVRVLREVLLMKHLKHPNVLALRDLFIVSGCVYLVTDLMESDLARVALGNQQFSERHVRYFLYQLLSALEHLHTAGIIHRDVKPSNILVNTNCKLKLADFGLGHEVVDAQQEKPKDLMTEYVGTRWYRAPELLLQTKNYNTGIDIWSAGCVGVELLTKQPLFPGRNPLDQLEKILYATAGDTPVEELQHLPKVFLEGFQARSHDKHALKNVLKDVPPDLSDLLQKMLAFNPERRLTVQQAMNHSSLAWFREEIAPVPAVDQFCLSDLPEKLEDLTKLLERSARFVTDRKSVMGAPLAAKDATSTEATTGDYNVLPPSPSPSNTATQGDDDYWATEREEALQLLPPDSEGTDEAEAAPGQPPAPPVAPIVELVGPPQRPLPFVPSPAFSQGAEPSHSLFGPPGTMFQQGTQQPYFNGSGSSSYRSWSGSTCAVPIAHHAQMQRPFMNTPQSGPPGVLPFVPTTAPQAVLPTTTFMNTLQSGPPGVLPFVPTTAPQAVVAPTTPSTGGGEWRFGQDGKYTFVPPSATGGSSAVSTRLPPPDQLPPRSRMKMQLQQQKQKTPEL